MIMRPKRWRPRTEKEKEALQFAPPTPSDHMKRAARHLRDMSVLYARSKKPVAPTFLNAAAVGGENERCPRCFLVLPAAELEGHLRGATCKWYEEMHRKRKQRASRAAAKVVPDDEGRSTRAVPDGDDDAGEDPRPATTSLANASVALSRRGRRRRTPAAGAQGALARERRIRELTSVLSAPAVPAPPAPPPPLPSPSRRPATVGGPPECSICLQTFADSPGLQVASLSCGHRFHRVCILRWAMHSSREHCPNCRTSFSKADLGQRRDVSSSGQREGPPELPPGWVSGGDPVYYYNFATGESSWTPPLQLHIASRWTTRDR